MIARRFARRLGRRFGFAALILAASVLGACKAQEDTFYAQVFSCDSALGNESCGTTRAGKPMMCFPAKKLGGTDFCAEACELSNAPAVPNGYECLASGALLRKCDPTAKPTNCPDGLQCYRTSLVAPQGVCIAMPVCNDDFDCPNSSRCAGTILRSILPAMTAIPIATDSLQCIHTGCETSSAACATDESCLGAHYSYGLPLDDICIPDCDAKLRCPPNFSCLRDIDSSPGGPKVCTPGLPGTRCSSSRDCIAGACADVGVEFKVCSIPCTSNAFCALLNISSDAFVCVGGYCLTPRAFNGSNCVVDGNCAKGLQCFTDGPYGPIQHQGECRLPCPADRRCPARGGLPHVCLGENQQGGCYPSHFGLPCMDASECIGDFSCLDAAPDPRSTSNYSPKICTLLCTTDADCDADPGTTGGGFCQDGICRLSGWIGTPCDRKSQCQSHRCDTDSKKCIAAVAL
jgi:hypothetical protein